MLFVPCFSLKSLTVKSENYGGGAVALTYSAVSALHNYLPCFTTPTIYLNG